MDGAGFGQRRIAGRNGNRRRPRLAGQFRRRDQVPRQPRVRNHHRAIAPAQQGRIHQLHVAITAAHTGQPQAEEFVLRIIGHHARIARPKKHNALVLTPSLQNRLGGRLQRLGRSRIAVLQKSGHRVVHHFDQHIARLVIHIHAAVHKRHPLADAAHQLELQIGQPVIAHAAAKAHHRRLAHPRQFRQGAHRQPRKRRRIIQHQLGHPLFGRCKRGERGSNTLKHGKSKGNGG